MKKYQEYSGCVMLDLYNPLWKNYIKERKQYNSLYTDFEDTPHVTLLYGIKNKFVKNAHNLIVEFLCKENTQNKLLITEKNPSIFISNRVVSKLDVINSSIDLYQMNSLLKTNYEYFTKYEEYHPHVTICYSDLVKINTPIKSSEFKIIGVHSSITSSEGYEIIERTFL